MSTDTAHGIDLGRMYTARGMAGAEARCDLIPMPEDEAQTGTKFKT